MGVDEKPSLVEIADVFARNGNFTLGGGGATVEVLHREISEKRRWISPDQFALSFALARLTPGTNLLAFGTGVGWLLKGWPGALVALLAGSGPSALIALAATMLLSQWRDNPWAQAAIHGAIAAAVAITVKTCWTIARPHYKPGSRTRIVVIAASAFAAHVGLGLPAIWVLLASAVLGAILPTTNRT